jgi:diguanylate cyclase (GGDEF)-like protein/PAS domain S-box-containing protein
MANDALMRMVGADPTGARVGDLFDVSSRRRLLELLEDPPGADTPPLAAQLCRHDDTWLDVELAVAANPDEPSLTVAVRPIGTVRLEALDELVLRAHDVLGEGVAIGDGQRLLHVNDAACELYGRTRSQILEARSLFDYLRADEQARIRILIRDRQRDSMPVPERHETVIVRPDGSEVQVELSVKAVVEQGRIRTLTIIRDIGERNRLMAELERLATHDALTGLANRLRFMDRLEHLVARAKREQICAAVLFIDLDGFKPVNDRYGHAVGDAVLVELGARLRTHVRACDTAARVGGDEFLILLEHVDGEDAARALASRLAERIAQPIILEHLTVHVSASIGLTVFADASVSPEELVRRADAAMYAAKRSGL